MAGEACVAGNDSGVDKGADEEHEPGRIAARIADPRRVANPLALMRVELGQPINPAVRDTVCGARIQHPHLVARDQADRLARRIVGQAEDHDVGLIEVPATHLRILARGLGNLDEGHVLARRQSIADLEPGRTRLPVDEYVRHCFEPCPARLAAGERTANPEPTEPGRRSHSDDLPGHNALLDGNIPE